MFFNRGVSLVQRQVSVAADLATAKLNAVDEAKKLGADEIHVSDAFGREICFFRTYLAR